MVFLDSCLDSTLQPGPVRVNIGPVKLVIDLQSHIGEERRLGTAKVVASASIQNLVVMLNFKDEMVDHSFSHVDLSIDEETEGDEIGIPIVQLPILISNGNFASTKVNEVQQ